MKRNIFVCILIIFAASVITGCATIGPGPFSGGNYQQIVLTPQKQVKQVTILRLSPESQKKMIHTPGTVVIGKSLFRIDSDELDNQTLEAQAESQAKDVDANVVLLSQSYLEDETKTKTVEKKSAFQKAAEDISLVAGGESYNKNSESTKQTQYTPTGSRTTTKKHSTSFGVSGFATLAELTALIPGNVVDETVNYQAKVYEIHAIFLRTPNYPGF